jgi:hypothetical protein
VPATSFCEPKGRSPATYYWFALKGDEDRSSFAFAGIWTRFRGNCRGEFVEIDTCSILTTTPNALVRPIHPDRMPVIQPPEVARPIEDALAASGCESAVVAHRPRLLTDNGSSYISGDVAVWLEAEGIDHVRGAPNHPRTQGKIERWHQTLKNRILLGNYYLPGALEEAIAAFVEHYNHQRYHESLGNLMPADVYFGRAETILSQRKEIKAQTIEMRRLLPRQTAA